MCVLSRPRVFISLIGCGIILSPVTALIAPTFITLAVTGATLSAIYEVITT